MVVQTDRINKRRNKHKQRGDRKQQEGQRSKTKIERSKTKKKSKQKQNMVVALVAVHDVRLSRTLHQYAGVQGVCGSLSHTRHINMCGSLSLSLTRHMRGLNLFQPRDGARSRSPALQARTGSPEQKHRHAGAGIQREREDHRESIGFIGGP